MEKVESKRSDSVMPPVDTAEILVRQYKRLERDYKEFLAKLKGI